MRGTAVKCLDTFWWWHSDQCEVIAHLIYNFLIVMWNIFSCDFWASICLLWRNIYLDVPPIVWLGCFLFILSCMSCLYILEINPMSVASFANIFSHFEGGFFVMVSFAVQNLLCLIRPHLFILFFIFILGSGSKKKKILLQFMLECSTHVFLWEFYKGSMKMYLILHLGR